MRGFLVFLAILNIGGCAEVLSYKQPSNDQADVYVQRVLPNRDGVRSGIWSLQISPVEGGRAYSLANEAYRFSLNPGAYRACYIVSSTVCADFTCAVVPNSLGSCTAINFEVGSGRRSVFQVDRGGAVSVQVF